MAPREPFLLFRSAGRIAFEWAARLRCSIGAAFEIRIGRSADEPLPTLPPQIGIAIVVAAIEVVPRLIG
jgi:hypothetical protein